MTPAEQQQNVYLEAQALHQELSDALSRTRIRSEYIALSAAAARAQRLVGYLTPGLPPAPAPVPLPQPETHD